MTDTTQTPAETRDQLTEHEQMQDAQKGCVACALCGGHAVITDAGLGAGYYVQCSNSKSYKKSTGCLIDQRRLGGWAYNVMDWWNRLHTAALTRRAGGDAPMLSREPTDLMMDAGLYQSSADSTWADVYSIWTAMYDVAALDGGSFTHLPAGGVAIPAKEAFDAWRRAQPSGDERFPYDIAKAAFLAGRESATPKPPAGGDAGAVERLVIACRDMLAQAFDYYKARNGRVCTIQGDDGEKCWIVPFDAFEDVRRAIAALALPAPVVEGATCKESLHVPPPVKGNLGEHADWMHVARESVAAALPGSAFADRVMAGHHDDSLEVRAAMRAIDATLAALSGGRSHG